MRQLHHTRLHGISASMHIFVDLLAYEVRSSYRLRSPRMAFVCPHVEGRIGHFWACVRCPPPLVWSMECHSTRISHIPTGRTRHTGTPDQRPQGDRRSYLNTLTGTALCRSACAASKCPARRRPAPCERHGPACSTPALDRLLLDEDGGLLLEDDGHLDDAGGRGLGLGRGDERADAQAPAA